MKIGDLGVAKIHETNNSNIYSSLKGTFNYLSPEIIDNIVTNDIICYSKYSDIW